MAVFLKFSLKKKFYSFIITLLQPLSMFSSMLREIDCISYMQDNTQLQSKARPTCKCRQKKMCNVILLSGLIFFLQC